MEKKNILQINRTYWNTNADDWFGVTALPQYGVQFVTEDELHFFGDVTGKKMLEIGCGSGHSLKFHADKAPPSVVPRLSGQFSRELESR